MAAIPERALTPEMKALEEQLDAQMQQLADVARRIWATPAKSWSDAAARAEVAAFWNRDQCCDEFGTPLDCGAYNDARSAAELIRAVLMLSNEGAHA